MLTIDGEMVALLGFQDSLRAEAAEAVRELHALGLRCIVLSGDRLSAAQIVADDIAADAVVAEALPSNKVEKVKELQQQGMTVAMVGDGINDGPALASANLGIAVGSGTDVALGAAQVVIMQNDLRVIATAIELSRRTAKTIRGNLIWAFGYNVAAIPIAVCGLLNPLVASAAMALSSAFVVFNSSRLRNIGKKY